MDNASGAGATMMPARYCGRVAQIRRALRVPLNQVLGYADMLLADLASDAPEGARTTLQTVRENGLSILDITQLELPLDSSEITPDHVGRLSNRILEPLGKMAAAFARLQDTGAPGRVRRRRRAPHRRRDHRTDGVYRRQARSFYRG